jgi:hypothetical protein
VVVGLSIAEQGGDGELPSREGVSSIDVPGVLVDPWEVPLTVVLRHCEPRSMLMRPKGGKYDEDIYVSTHVDDCLICCKSAATMGKFKLALLTRFQGTDEGEVKEYLGCEIVRDRAIDLSETFTRPRQNKLNITLGEILRRLINIVQ